MEIVKRGLKIMDTTAVTLSMDNKLPIVVFNFDQEDNLKRLVMGESVGTKVQE
jgi:uridylate kinase